MTDTIAGYAPALCHVNSNSPSTQTLAYTAASEDELGEEIVHDEVSPFPHHVNTPLFKFSLL